jgi:hypothetical protein
MNNALVDLTIVAYRDISQEPSCLPEERPDAQDLEVGKHHSSSTLLAPAPRLTFLQVLLSLTLLDSVS